MVFLWRHSHYHILVPKSVPQQVPRQLVKHSNLRPFTKTLNLNSISFIILIPVKNEETLKQVKKRKKEKKKRKKDHVEN